MDVNKACILLLISRELVRRHWPGIEGVHKYGPLFDAEGRQYYFHDQEGLRFTTIQSKLWLYYAYDLTPGLAEQNRYKVRRNGCRWLHACASKEAQYSVGKYHGVGVTLALIRICCQYSNFLMEMSDNNAPYLHWFSLGVGKCRHLLWNRYTGDTYWKSLGIFEVMLNCNLFIFLKLLFLLVRRLQNHQYLSGWIRMKIQSGCIELDNKTNRTLCVWK